MFFCYDLKREREKENISNSELTNRKAISSQIRLERIFLKCKQEKSDFKNKKI